MKHILTLCFLLVAFPLFSQGGPDVIYMKNGSIYRGFITEYTPGNTAIIKLLDDRIVTVRTDSVMDMKMGNKRIVKKQFDLKQKGYFHHSSLGLLSGKSEFGPMQVNFAYNMVNGYRIKKHHFGAGLGLERHVGNWYVPIYADYSYPILKGATSPIVGINGGLMLPLGDGRIERYNYEKGSFFGVRVGVLAYSNPHFAMMVHITYRYIYLREAAYTDSWWWGEIREMTGSAQLHRVGVMLGFVLN